MVDLGVALTWIVICGRQREGPFGVRSRRCDNEIQEELAAVMRESGPACDELYDRISRHSAPPAERVPVNLATSTGAPLPVLAVHHRPHASGPNVDVGEIVDEGCDLAEMSQSRGLLSAVRHRILAHSATEREPPASVESSLLPKSPDCGESCLLIRSTNWGPGWVCGAGFGVRHTRSAIATAGLFVARGLLPGCWRRCS